MLKKTLVSVTSLQTSWSESDKIRLDVYYTKNKFTLKTTGMFKAKRKYAQVTAIQSYI